MKEGKTYYKVTWLADKFLEFLLKGYSPDNKFIMEIPNSIIIDFQKLLQICTCDKIIILISKQASFPIIRFFFSSNL